MPSLVKADWLVTDPFVDMAGKEFAAVGISLSELYQDVSRALC